MVFEGKVYIRNLEFTNMGEESGNATEPIISASALEKYGYCPLSWWLSRDEVDEDSPELREGERAHESVATDLGHIVKDESEAKVFESVVLWFAIAATLISIIGVSFMVEVGQDIGMIMSVIALIWILAACYFLYKAETMPKGASTLRYQRIILIFAIVAAVLGVNSVTLLSEFFQPKAAQILQAISLAWLVGACYFLYHSLKKAELAMFRRKKHKLQHDIAYIDSKKKKPKLFVSERHGLSGRPDFVLLVENEHIPVELKTGRVPRGPLFSHIMQVATYCILMEDEFGDPPSHGLIRYGQVEYEVDYEEGLKDLVLSKAVEMRQFMKSGGGVHRNHNKAGKCRHCSRRAVCPEKLA